MISSREVVSEEVTCGTGSEKGADIQLLCYDA